MITFEAWEHPGTFYPLPLPRLCWEELVSGWCILLEISFMKWTASVAFEYK